MTSSKQFDPMNKHIFYHTSRKFSELYEDFLTVIINILTFFNASMSSNDLKATMFVVLICIREEMPFSCVNRCISDVFKFVL